MISETTIHAIRELHIEDVLSKYMTVKNHKASCPFHNEKSASLMINTKRNYFKCFGCGAGGDAIKFVQLHEKLTFTEALERIAKAHGIEVEYTQQDPEQRAKYISRLDEARQVLDFAHDYYRKQLRIATPIKDMLLARGYDDDKLEEWQLGYAPDGWQGITKPIIERGWYDMAIELGLLKTKNEQHYDTYRNRIIIPIHDRQGQIIGFGGRTTLDTKDEAKYINPCENFIYSKSNELFGLDRAAKAIKQANRVRLAEGYFDVMSMHNAGIENVVCSSGTAVTDAQLKTLKRYTDNLDLMMDGDAAGQKAYEKILPMALKLGFNVYHIDLGGMDPDEFIKQNLSHAE